MNFYRTRDFNAVHGVLTHPEIYPYIGDDYAPSEPSAFRVNEDERIWYVMARHSKTFQLVGLFSLIPQNHICWEVHAVMVPGALIADKWAAARELIPWLKWETDCERLVAAVPMCNRPAIVYGTHGLGLKYVGRHERAFLKDGQLQDLVLLGRSVNE